MAATASPLGHWRPDIPESSPCRPAFFQLGFYQNNAVGAGTNLGGSRCTELARKHLLKSTSSKSVSPASSSASTCAPYEGAAAHSSTSTTTAASFCGSGIGRRYRGLERRAAAMDVGAVMPPQASWLARVGQGCLRCCGCLRGHPSANKTERCLIKLPTSTRVESTACGPSYHSKASVERRTCGRSTAQMRTSVRPSNNSTAVDRPPWTGKASQDVWRWASCTCDLPRIMRFQEEATRLANKGWRPLVEGR
eukprot:363869-Chlamydomonas_euryale.AAC.10